MGCHKDSPFFVYKQIFMVKGQYMTQDRLDTIINEELTKQEVRSVIAGELDALLKEKEFKKAVRRIASDVLDDFFREMWRKKGFWKNAVQNV